MFNQLVVSDTSKGLVHIFFAQRTISKVQKLIKLRKIYTPIFFNVGIFTI